MSEFALETPTVCRHPHTLFAAFACHRPAQCTHTPVREPALRTLTAVRAFDLRHAGIEFDLVTARLARPWAWRDRSSAPMYASGNELKAAGAAWEQGESRGCRVGGGRADEWPTTDRANPMGAHPSDGATSTGTGVGALDEVQAMIEQLNASIAQAVGGVTADGHAVGESVCMPADGPSRLRRATGIDGTRWNGTRRVPMAGDVVAFLTRVHTLRRSKRFASLDNDTQLHALFGVGGAQAEAPTLGTASGSLGTPPAHHLGRECSLNVHRLTSYGTLEFRRFHGTLDPVAVVNWARFCVGFVEAFRHVDSGGFFVAPLAEGLGALRLAQERATFAMLAERLHGTTGADSVKALWHDAEADYDD